MEQKRNVLQKPSVFSSDLLKSATCLRILPDHSTESQQKNGAVVVCWPCGASYRRVIPVLCHFVSHCPFRSQHAYTIERTIRVLIQIVHIIVFTRKHDGELGGLWIEVLWCLANVCVAKLFSYALVIWFALRALFVDCCRREKQKQVGLWWQFRQCIALNRVCYRNEILNQYLSYIWKKIHQIR